MKSCLLILFSVLTTTVIAQHVVINEVYGAGGNAGAAYRNDYIELFNPSSSVIPLTGWSVQYAAATATGNWQVTALTGSILPGGHYLIQLAAGAGNGLSLPQPDAMGTTAMAATAGKVALVNVMTALAGACPTSVSIVDRVGFGGSANCFEGTGPTPAPSATLAVMRKNTGVDTDNNAADFHAAPAEPRNSQRTPQTISFAALPGHTYGEVPFALTATSSSGLPVTFKSSDETIAVISGTSLALRGAGQAIITAQQGGNADVEPAPDVAHSLTVGKAMLTVKANDQTRFTGEPNPPLTVSYSGFVSTDDETDLDALPVISTLANPSSLPGDYTITLSGGFDNNYVFALVPGQLSVLPAASELTYLKSPLKVGVDLSPRLTCMAVAGATTYTIEVNTAPDFTGISRIQSGPRSQVFNNLTWLTTYYVRVRTNLVSAWGPVRSFTTGAPVDVSHVIKPVMNETKVSWLPTIIVNDMGASTYTLQLSLEVNFNSFLEFTSGTPEFPINQSLQYNTQYFARTKNDLTNSLWGPVRSFTTGSPAGVAFVKVPENNAVGVNYQLTVTSVLVPGASRYSVSISTRADFSGEEIVASSSTRMIPVSLSPDTKYYCRVNTDLSSVWGTVQTFTTGNPLSLAYVIRPLPGAIIASLRPMVSSQLIAGAETYTIELSERPDFGGVSIIKSAKSRSIRFTLEPAKTYYSRVKTDLSSGQWGVTRSFSTMDAVSVQQATAVEIQEEIQAIAAVVSDSVHTEATFTKNELTLYPNPFSSTFTVRGSASEKRKLWIRVRDTAGREVYFGAHEPGADQTFGADWGPGMYVVQVWGGGFEVVKRVVKR